MIPLVRDTKIKYLWITLLKETEDLSRMWTERTNTVAMTLLLNVKESNFQNHSSQTQKKKSYNFYNDNNVYSHKRVFKAILKKKRFLHEYLPILFQIILYTYNKNK